MNARPLLHAMAACLSVLLLMEGGQRSIADTAAAGPKPAGVAEEADQVGCLQVFSSTEQRVDGDQTYFYPHTRYAIYNAQGKRIRWIRNGDVNEEQPEKVTLPRGKYVVWAQSDSAGWVHVPVVIETGSFTVLHLEKSDWKPARNAKVVRLPNGEIVGYAAN